MLGAVDRSRQLLPAPPVSAPFAHILFICPTWEGRSKCERCEGYCSGESGVGARLVYISGFPIFGSQFPGSFYELDVAIIVAFVPPSFLSFSSLLSIYSSLALVVPVLIRFT